MTAESPYPWATRVTQMGEREIIEMTCASVWAYEEAHGDFWHVHLWTEDAAPCPHVVVLGGVAGGAFHRQRFDTWDEAEAWLREDVEGEAPGEPARSVPPASRRSVPRTTASGRVT